MKRLLAFLIVLALAVPTVFSATFSLQTDAQSVFMLSLDTGETVFEKAADVRRAPASLTKVMTALVVLELCTDLQNETVTVPDVSLFKAIKDEGGVEMALIEGETFTVSQLLHAMMLASACDAAQLLAWHFGGGSVEAFVGKMNEKAAVLGLSATHFVNPHGLEALDHYSTARDMAAIVRKALENAVFTDIISKYSYIIPATEKSAARNITYTIAMLNPQSSLYYPGMIGVKSGYTSQAGRCLASAAERNGMKFLLVVMGANLGTENSSNLAYTDTAALYDYAFTNLELREVVNTEDVYATVKVTGGSEEATLELRADKSVKLICPKGAEVRLTVDAPEELEAPVSEGRLGSLTIYVGDEPAEHADLVNAEAVAAVASQKTERISPYTMPEQGNILTNDRVTVILLIVLAAVILLTVLLARFQKKR